jgi:hypothetical protein
LAVVLSILFSFGRCIVYTQYNGQKKKSMDNTTAKRKKHRQYNGQKKKSIDNTTAKRKKV